MVSTNQQGAGHKILLMNELRTYARRSSMHRVRLYCRQGEAAGRPVWPVSSRVQRAFVSGRHEEVDAAIQRHPRH
jgi:hypothetical protein